jgi:hypothetical protein
MAQSNDLQVIVLIWQFCSNSCIQLNSVLPHQVFINPDFRWSKSWRCYKLEIRETNQLASKSQEWFLKVLVALGRNVIVLKVLLAMKSNIFGHNLAFSDINLVTAQDDWDILADANQITVPVWHILVGNT